MEVCNKLNWGKISCKGGSPDLEFQSWLVLPFNILGIPPGLKIAPPLNLLWRRRRHRCHFQGQTKPSWCLWWHARCCPTYPMMCQPLLCPVLAALSLPPLCISSSNPGHSRRSSSCKQVDRDDCPSPNYCLRQPLQLATWMGHSVPFYAHSHRCKESPGLWTYTFRVVILSVHLGTLLLDPRPQSFYTDDRETFGRNVCPSPQESLPPARNMERSAHVSQTILPGKRDLQR